MKSQLNYYTILNISPTASDEEIKKAFFKMARKYHPDKNKGNKLAEKKFKQINLAYQILKDASSREEFDKNLASYQEFLKQQKQSKIKEDFLKQQQKQTQETKNDLKNKHVEKLKKWFSKDGKKEEAIDVNVDFLVSIEDLCQQKTKILEYQKPYNGMLKTENLEIQIPNNIKHGTKLQFKNCGGARGKKTLGHLFVKIKIQKHPLFHLDGDNVLYDLPISFTKAYLGGKIKAPSPYGLVEIKIAPETKQDHLYRFKNLGLAKKNGQRGNMFVKVLIDYPEGYKTKIQNEMKKMSKEEKAIYIGQQHFKDEDFKQVTQFKKYII